MLHITQLNSSKTCFPLFDKILVILTIAEVYGESNKWQLCLEIVVDLGQSGSLPKQPNEETAPIQSGLLLFNILKIISFLQSFGLLNVLICYIQMFQITWISMIEIEIYPAKSFASVEMFLPVELYSFHSTDVSQINLQFMWYISWSNLTLSQTSPGFYVWSTSFLTLWEKEKLLPQCFPPI